MTEISRLHDIMLPFPLEYGAAKLLLFIIFVIHLTLVLLMIGTAILAAVDLFLGRRDPSRSEHGYRALRGFVSLKSLAVVFGVGPILLMQMAQPVPFLTSVNRLAPYWISLVLLISVAFYLIDSIAHHDSRSPQWRLRRMGPGLILLLSVPMIFVAVLVGAENYAVPARALFLHWLVRYLHVIGASIVIGSLFQYFFATRSLAPGERKGRRLFFAKWVFVGALFQILDGIALYISLPMRATPLANGLVLLGATVAMLLLFRIFRLILTGKELGLAESIAIGTLLVVPMLGARQALQDSVLVPQQKLLGANALARATELEPLRQEAVRDFRRTVNEPQKGATTIYMKSCSFCHGVVGNGRGPDAGKLKIPPQDLTAIRFKPGKLRSVLLDGIPGTAMPRFNYYTKSELDELTAFLDEEFAILQKPKPIPVRLDAMARSRAGEIYETECRQCHGSGGKPDAEAIKAYNPPPPDLTQIGFEPERSFEIITRGYPGTAMMGYEAIPEQDRWALVELLAEFYRN